MEKKLFIHKDLLRFRIYQPGCYSYFLRAIFTNANDISDHL